MTESRNVPDGAPKFHGRRKGRPLRPGRQVLIETLLPKITIPTDRPDPASKGLDPLSLFEPPVEKVWLEVGFGGGEHLAALAERHPEIGFLGCEPYINGVAKLLSQIDDQKLKNVRILHGDARPFLEALPDASLDRLFVLHPDPWPKKKHHKRRIVSPGLLAEAARLLVPGAELRVASDIPDYIRWTLMQVQIHNSASRDFGWTATCRADWADRPEDWPQTRYEAKAIREGRIPTYLKFVRL